jgi:hypothetical protein
LIPLFAPTFKQKRYKIPQIAFIVNRKNDSMGVFLCCRRIREFREFSVSKKFRERRRKIGAPDFSGAGSQRLRGSGGGNQRLAEGSEH